jgi:hypothetical protein
MLRVLEKIILRGYMALKVHKNKNFVGSNFEFCSISFLVMYNY